MRAPIERLDQRNDGASGGAVWASAAATSSDTPWIRSLVLASLLFVLFEIGSFGFGGFVAPAVQQVVGFWGISVANPLAAVVMATFLRARGERIGLHPAADAP